MPSFFSFQRLGFELGMCTSQSTSPKFSFSAKGPVLELGRKLRSAIRRLRADVPALHGELRFIPAVARGAPAMRFR